VKIYLIGMFENPTAERLSQLKTASFAHFAAVGTWVSEREVCDSCDWHWQRIRDPLLVQWEPSTDRIGDFSWDGPFGYVFVVKVSVAEKLAELGIECTFLPVNVVRPKRKRNTVGFPYVGPRLVWGNCSATLNLDEDASKVKMESSCADCGDVRYTFRNAGIVIRRREWGGQHMFRIATNGRSRATFVTEQGREILENSGFSNIAFSLAGDIVR
jgi:hypothetical protein